MPIMWNKKKYSKEDLRIAVENNKSYRGVAKTLGMNPNAGGIYYGIKAAIEDLSLDTSHFLGKGWNKGDIANLKNFNSIPLEDILVEKSTYLNTGNLKSKLLKNNLLVNKCYAPFCPVPNPTINPFTGESKELKLSLDHINGNRFDNRIENLRLLCYHCHGETDTWCGKNNTRVRRQNMAKSAGLGPVYKDNNLGGSSSLPAPTKICACGQLKQARSKQCIKCEYKARSGRTVPQNEKINWPNDEELILLIKNSNYYQTGKTLGVSDNAVRKRVKKRKLIL